MSRVTKYVRKVKVMPTDERINARDFAEFRKLDSDIASLK